ncbi:hypothetical protein [Spirochaeta isovalerica]|uniref:Uncharacterized protein n=1 Tax=Spirochaeta isovalerica TaxID=150 RepID=A0A841R7B9_9SPIO|nr:hypothetical protein [Spirochaeta isovalerica]MBB6479097.1 hypothetical protein [Spirochaeta isovalerica]
MALSLDLENDELATLFFYIQQDEKCLENPVMEKLAGKMEALIFSRFSIDEIEQFRKKAGESTMEESLR